MKTLGDHIRRRRVELGLKQSEVAKRLGVTESTVWNWESNTTKPAWQLWSSIIGFLGYDPLPKPGTLGERLATSRRMQGLSQKEMAERLDVDQSTLARWERGERRPTPQFLHVLGPQYGGEE